MDYLFLPPFIIPNPMQYSTADVTCDGALLIRHRADQVEVGQTRTGMLLGSDDVDEIAAHHILRFLLQLNSRNSIFP